MNRRHVTVLFSGVYVACLAYNLLVGSPGYLDNAFSLLLVVALYRLSSWAELTAAEMALANLPLIFHNLGTLGTFNIYGLTFIVAYDTFVHFLGSSVVAWLFAQMLARKNVLQGVWWRASFAVSAVLLLGVGIEFTEFTGYLLLPPSAGFFFPSSDPSSIANYADTIKDLFVNLLGATMGVVAFQATRRKRPPGRRSSRQA